MKRDPSLQPLSDDHHRALVLARSLRRTSTDAASEDLAAMARAVRARFEAELEPHFRIEEERLLPALAAAGAGELVARTKEDHERVRELVQGRWSQETPRELGELLERHVRFEERVLFPRAEEALAREQLDAVCGPSPA